VYKNQHFSDLQTENRTGLKYAPLWFPRPPDLKVCYEHRTLVSTCDIVLHVQHGAQPLQLLCTGTY